MASSTLPLMHKVELLKRIAENPNIPSPPTVVLRVLEKTSKPECTIGELCPIIQIDPGLAGKILRIVNSALFGLSRPVTSIQRALTVVGINSARLLLLAISLPDMQQTRSLNTLSKQRYWKTSVAGAIVARELSQRLRGREPEDDMAAGLLRDLGELVLQDMFPDNYQEVDQQPQEIFVQSQCDLEEKHCGLDHAEVTAFILNRWRLPADMTEAIRHHHKPEDGKYSSPAAENRAYLLYFATRAAQLLMHPDQPNVLRDIFELAARRYEMNEDDVRSFLIPLSQKMSDFASLLQVDLGATSDFNTVLAGAGEELVRLSVSANLENQRAQERSQRAESDALRWKNEAAFDPLTKVFNRRFLEMKLHEIFNRAKSTSTPFGLLFIDLDGFKLLNDRFGHSFGDLVLQQIADCLNREVRQVDFVARYGGDEFCILCEGMDQIGLQSLSQRVWRTVNELTIYQGSHVGKVGASIGAVCHHITTPWNTPEEFLAAADKAMYLAKSRGKNRVVFLEPQPELANASNLPVENHLIDHRSVATGKPL